MTLVAQCATSKALLSLTDDDSPWKTRGFLCLFLMAPLSDTFRR